MCGYNYWGVYMLVEYMRQSCMLDTTRPLMDSQIKMQTEKLQKSKFMLV